MTHSALPISSPIFATDTTLPHTLIRVTEHTEYNAKLHQATLFPYRTPHRSANIKSATLAFRFRSISFDKKRALPFFLARELLTQQKGVAILARRHLLAWKVRKGSLVGCRVTIRNSSLSSFLDTLELSLPRIESITPPSVTSRREHRLQVEYERQKLIEKRGDEGRPRAAQAFYRSSRSVRRAASESFTFGELTLFAPFEIGLGLHPDVQRFHLSLTVSSRPVEERLFLFRTVKLPVV